MIIFGVDVLEIEEAEEESLVLVGTAKNKMISSTRGNFIFKFFIVDFFGFVSNSEGHMRVERVNCIVCIDQLFCYFQFSETLHCKIRIWKDESVE